MRVLWAAQPALTLAATALASVAAFARATGSSRPRDDDTADGFSWQHNYAYETW